MIVVTNRIPVAEGHEAEFEDRFKKRVHLVDEAPGFVRNEVHRPKPMKLDHATGGWSPGTSRARRTARCVTSPELPTRVEMSSA